jgi:hypothetical protein
MVTSATRFYELLPHTRCLNAQTLEAICSSTPYVPAHSREQEYGQLDILDVVARVLRQVRIETRAQFQVCLRRLNPRATAARHKNVAIATANGHPVALQAVLIHGTAAKKEPRCRRKDAQRSRMLV